MEFDYSENFFYVYSRILKKYRRYTVRALDNLDFTPGEIQVMIFLINNGEIFDTASDISYYKGMSKGLVSKSVNSLIARGYLASVADTNDKRVNHLSITDKSEELVELIKSSNANFKRLLLEDIRPEDLSFVEKIHKNMLNNLRDLK